MMSGHKINTLVSELMASANTPAEARAIASLADAHMFESPDFVRFCVPPPRTRVVWRRVAEMANTIPHGDARVEPLRRAAEDARLSVPEPPESLDDLQVAIELDQMHGRVLAAWRDAYAADVRTPNPYHHHIDLCLDELRRRGECWSCGRPADTTINELLACTGCKENA